jgi:peptidoglycan/LPS O-acetylase OafA/YrhL
MKKHIVQLDGLRFYAVLMVMVAHWLQWQWTNPILKGIYFSHGVTLFFVLSGFLITDILLRNRDQYNSKNLNKWVLVKNFYIRRFFRIFPLYYLLIFALFFADYQKTREIFPWLVSYTSNIYQSIHHVYIGEFNHFWSLAVEEQFYLFWPFLILFIRPKKTLVTIFVVILFSLLLKAYLFYFVDGWMAGAYFTFSCMHALGLGAVLAYFKNYKPEVIKRLSKPKWLYLSGAVYIVLLIFQNTYEWHWYKNIFEDFFFAVFAMFIILRASTNGFKGIAKWGLENRFVVYSGKISYGLYVFHLFIPSLYMYMLDYFDFVIHRTVIYFGVLYMMTFAAAYISWNLIEAPINRLKNKVPYLKK